MTNFWALGEFLRRAQESDSEADLKVGQYIWRVADLKFGHYTDGGKLAEFGEAVADAVA